MKYNSNSLFLILYFPIYLNMKHFFLRNRYQQLMKQCFIGHKFEKYVCSCLLYSPEWLFQTSTVLPQVPNPISTLYVFRYNLHFTRK